MTRPVEDNRGLVSIIHPTGNANVRMAARALMEANRLDQLVTSIAWSADREIPPLLPSAIRRELEKRTYQLPEARLHRRVREEIVRNLLLRSPSRPLRALGEPWAKFGVDWVARNIDHRYSQSLRRRDGLTAVFGYQGTSIQSFRSAAKAGVGRVLEVTHAHWRATESVYLESAERDPEWSSTIARPGAAGREAADEQLNMATLIFSPSRQVTNSLIAHDPNLQVRFNPYGCPPVRKDASVRRWSGEGPLEVLFVGRLTAGKGLAALASMTKALGSSVSVTVIGARPNVESTALDQLLQRCRYLGTIPSPAVRQAMQKAHLFVLPSLVEGRSLAALEALSTGLPMVVTPGSGVDDLVEQGAGYVVPNGDKCAFTRAIEDIVHNPSLIEEFSLQSLRIARENGWSRYREEIDKMQPTGARS